MNSTPTVHDRTNCDPCVHAAEHGWWGSGFRGTHCRDCHVTYPSSQRWGHCARCHETFSGVRTFDLHQRFDAETGDLSTDCLCTVAVSRAGQKPPYGAPRSRRWAVGNETLTYHHAEWGAFWRRDAPRAFGGGR
jgi:hypothetical protein